MPQNSEFQIKAEVSSSMKNLKESFTKLVKTEIDLNTNYLSLITQDKKHINI